MAQHPQRRWEIANRYPDQALTVNEAIQAMTLSGAEGAFQEQQIGSLEVGKFADFIELDQDPRKVKPGDLKSLIKGPFTRNT